MTTKRTTPLTKKRTRTAPEKSEGQSNKQPSTTENQVLRDRLGLIGYRCETVLLSQPVEILGCEATKVVFAKQMDGDDRVFLHVALVSASGKRSIASSRKKIPEAEWSVLAEALAGMKLVWRERQ